ncbi:MAG: hypothetical protein PSX71_06980 [bacterium]|nr:hypothetical protein [bacterium]
MHYLRALCLGLLLMTGLPAQAAAPAAELQSLRDGAYHATTQLMMYAILERAGERQTDAGKIINTLDPRVAALNDKELLASWQAARAALINGPYQGNDVNQIALYAMEDRTTEFARLIGQRMPHELSRQQRTLFDLTERMQVLMTIYLRNSADPIGGTNYSGINRDLDPAKLVKEFSAQLDELAKTQPALAVKIKPKWHFLITHLSNFNSQLSVPYLVDIYGRQIIDLLLATASKP